MPSSLVYGKHLVCGVDAGGRAQVIDNGALFQRDGRIVDIGTASELRARTRPMRRSAPRATSSCRGSSTPTTTSA